MHLACTEYCMGNALDGGDGARNVCLDHGGDVDFDWRHGWAKREKLQHLCRPVLSGRVC